MTIPIPDFPTLERKAEIQRSRNCENAASDGDISNLNSATQPGSAAKGSTLSILASGQVSGVRTMRDLLKFLDVEYEHEVIDDTSKLVIS